MTETLHFGRAPILATNKQSGGYETRLPNGRLSLIDGLWELRYEMPAHGTFEYIDGDGETGEEVYAIVALLSHGRYLAGWSRGQGMLAALERDVYTDKDAAFGAARQMADDRARLELEDLQEGIAHDLLVIANPNCPECGAEIPETHPKSGRWYVPGDDCPNCGHTFELEETKSYVSV